MLPRRTHTQLENIAEDFLKKHGKFDGRSVLIDLTVQKYGYYVWTLKGLGEFAQGFVPNKPGLIFIDEDHYMNQPIGYRFTLAEELAHILIHIPHLRGKSQQQIDDFNQRMTATDYRAYEHDAKYLASCLLMPKTSFVERFKSHFSTQAERVSNRSQVLRYAVRQLHLDFCVPPSAAAQRAYKLKLIDEGELVELGY